MKTLLIMRHAKSSWKDPGAADHDRPLNKRGKRDAPRMGELLREKQLVPDWIISSSAKRAAKTATKAAKACGYMGNIETTEQLYFTDPETWLPLLQQIPNNHSRVMIVGHNPGLEIFLAMLTGEREILPTAALVLVTLPIDHWLDLNLETRGTLEEIWRPKDLASS